MVELLVGQQRLLGIVECFFHFVGRFENEE